MRTLVSSKEWHGQNNRPRMFVRGRLNSTYDDNKLFVVPIRPIFEWKGKGIHEWIEDSDEIYVRSEYVRRKNWTGVQYGNLQGGLSSDWGSVSKISGGKRYRPPVFVSKTLLRIPPVLI